MEIGKEHIPEIDRVLTPSSKITASRIPVVSYFKSPISNTVPFKEISLLDIYHLLRSTEFLKSTETLRSITEKHEARRFKANSFDYVTFSGTFSKRNDNSLLGHSGLITIDFDHVKDIKDLKIKLFNDEYFETELLFVSPSGDGLKWIVPIDLKKSNHSDFFRAIANYIQHQYDIKVDPSGKDVSRACFLPHDTEVFINPKYL
jgi:hypothetical protein